ncbi:ras-associated and pleckstrin homology domains-containing protein 1 isoform X1 [Setaria italica]|nr:ras-associated and pleckstrin homology domains-containing protein 1 isoform X1 [Setaria italica]
MTRHLSGTLFPPPAADAPARRSPLARSLTRRRRRLRLPSQRVRPPTMATVEGDKIEPPGLGPRTRRSAATRETGDMAGGAGEGEREGPLGYVLSLPAASLPLPVAVSCLDATVPRKARSRLRLRVQPCAWWAFKLPVPAPEEAKSPAPPASMATNPTEEARSPRPQRLRVRHGPPPSPDDPHTPSPAMERPAKRARRCLQCGAVETPQWRSGPMGSGTLCNACGVRLKAAGALREQVHRPPPASARTVAEPPPESPVSDSSPDGPIWEPGSVPDVYLLRKKPPKQGKPPPPRMEPASPPAPAPAVYLLKKKKKKPPKASKKKPWRPRKSSKRCLHCGSSSTPQWREGPMGRSTLCNACGVRYRQGRLLPEYRPLASPSFEPSEHANRHSQVLQLHRQRKGQKNQPPLPTEQPRLMDDLTGALACSGDGDDPMNVLLPRRWHDKDEYPRTPLHQPLPQPADSLPGDPRVGGIDATAQGRGGRGNDPNGAPSSLDSLLLEGPSAPLIDDGDESLIE